MGSSSEKSRVGLAQAAELFERIAHVVVGIGKVAFQRDGAPKLSRRATEVAVLEGDALSEIDSVVIVGAERKRPLRGGCGFIDLVSADQHRAEVEMVLGIARLDRVRGACMQARPARIFLVAPAS